MGLRDDWLELFGGLAAFGYAVLTAVNGNWAAAVVGASAAAASYIIIQQKRDIQELEEQLPADD